MSGWTHSTVLSAFTTWKWSAAPTVLHHRVPPSWGLPHVLMLLRTRERRGHRHPPREGGGSLSYSPPLFFLRNVIPGHCWPLLTPATPKPSPFLSATLIFAVLSTGVQTTLCLEEEEEGSRGSGKKRTLPFSWLGLITIQLRTSIWVEAADSDTRFQRFRFPGLLKRSDEKGRKGARGWGVRRSKKKSLWLCRGWRARAEGTSPPHRKRCVSADTICSISQSQSVRIMATTKLSVTNTSNPAPLTTTDKLLFGDKTRSSNIKVKRTENTQAKTN